MKLGENVNLKIRKIHDKIDNLNSKVKKTKNIHCKYIIHKNKLLLEEKLKNKVKELHYHTIKELMENKKIEYIIASGDNRTTSYNEPKYMRNSLLKLGVDSGYIISDCFLLQ